MKHQLELSETELLALAKKQLKADGIIPKDVLMVHPSRCKEPDSRGEYTFLLRWGAIIGE